MKDEACGTSNYLGEVQACDCGGVNLSIGSLTLHVTADEAEALGDLVGAAVDLVRTGARPKPAARAGRGQRAPRLLH